MLENYKCFFVEEKSTLGLAKQINYYKLILNKLLILLLLFIITNQLFENNSVEVGHLLRISLRYFLSRMRCFSFLVISRAKEEARRLMYEFNCTSVKVKRRGNFRDSITNGVSLKMIARSKRIAGCVRSSWYFDGEYWRFRLDQRAGCSF